VASIPSARIQIYFIDNDDYFERKAVLVDENGEEFADNDERAIFFARGVLETVKKLNWAPTVVHCLGWMSAITPIYLKKVFHDDPLFRDVKIVVTLCDDKFEKQLSDNFKEKIASEGVNDPKLEDLSNPSYENLYRFVIDYADGVVIASEKADASLVEYARQSGKPLLEYNNPDEAECFDNYNRFYEEL
jgi:starch synthase